MFKIILKTLDKGNKKNNRKSFFDCLLDSFIVDGRSNSL
jgi:hypothetical protein